jgi:anti-anti-sigma factor
MEDRMLLGRARTGSVIRIEGRATMRESPALRSAAEAALDSGALVWDLAECEYLDSTMLGCLIGVRKLAEQRGRRMDIVADRSQQVKLFSTSSLHKYFEFVDESPAIQGMWLAIEPDRVDNTELSRHVLKCHERLAERGGEDGEAFRRVCDRLSTEIEQHDMDRALAAAERGEATPAGAPRTGDGTRE